MTNILGGPLVRQALQFLAGGLVSAGIVTADELTTVLGAVASVANIGWVIYARTRPAR